MKNLLLTGLFLIAVAVLLLTCLRDEFEQLEFVEVLTLEPKILNDDITLLGSFNQLSQSAIREYGFILSTTDSLPQYLMNDTILSLPGPPPRMEFEMQARKSNLFIRAPFYYIRAYAIQELPDRERISYGAPQRLDFALQITIAAPQHLCSTQEAAFSAVIINRPLDKPIDQCGFVYSTENQQPELGKDRQTILGAVPTQAPDPYTFTDTLTGLNKDSIYFIRAFAIYSGQSPIYSTVVSIQLTEQDTDGDGITDNCDDDDDDDGVSDGQDPNALNEFICGDRDNDNCDDCSRSGYFSPENDGDDFDRDGKCDSGDDDDDNDGVPDVNDPYDFDRYRCGDSDNDNCDDCSIAGFFFPANDGPDNDLDGLCDSGDPDDDNDGVLDEDDPFPRNPYRCGSNDNDSCDDCSIGTDGFGPLSDCTPENDGC